MTKSWPLAFFSWAAAIILVYYQQRLLTLVLIVVLMAGGIILQKYSRPLFLCLLVLLAGLLYAGLFINPLPPQLPVVQTSISGTVQDFPVLGVDKTTFLVKTSHASRWEKKIRVVCYFKADIARGDRILIRGNLKPPTRPGNPGEFNYPLYLSHNGVYYNLTVKNKSDLRLLAHEQGILKWVDRFRGRGEAIARDILPPRESAILLGMLLGTQGEIDEEQYEAFQKTGIVHLFSVSGLHVGFLLLLVGWVSALLGLSKRNRFLAGVIILLLYGTMIGWPVCVIRAILMGILGLLAFYSGRENALLNALAIAGIVTLLINPNSLFTISFQLTFMASWGLLYIFPFLQQASPWKGWAWDLFWLPVAAELAVLPLIAYYFNMLTPVSIVTNILVSYISGMAVIFGFLALFLACFIPILAADFFYLAGFLTELILGVVNWVQYLPGGYIWVASPGVGMIILYYTALIISVFKLQKSGRRWMLVPAAMLALFFIVLLMPAGVCHRGYLEVDFLDVGQGDCILLKSPRGKFMLVDGGGNTFYDPGKVTVLPYLHRRGIRKLSLLVNSHPDNDHLQGLVSISAEMPVKAIAVPDSLINSPDYMPLRKAAAQRSIPVMGLQDGQEIQLEKGLKISVLHPEKHNYAISNNNNQSVVLRVCYGKFAVLLTGDIEADAIQELLNEGKITAATVVKVPHHGSKGSISPEFYRQASPGYAIISVGRNNLFGHPHPNTLAMLKEQNITVMRTDQNGAVLIFSDGNKLLVKPTYKTGEPENKN